jgi:hypothetical protein
MLDAWYGCPEGWGKERMRCVGAKAPKAAVGDAQASAAASAKKGWTNKSFMAR